jgi:mRNA interferase RelE/StbE
MAWKIEFHPGADKELAKLGAAATQRILRFLHDRVASLDNPRAIGEALKGSKLGEFWKYRVGDYRVIARIEDSVVTIFIVRIGDRKSVYRR